MSSSRTEGGSVMDSICLVLLRLRGVLHSLYKTPCASACDRFVIALALSAEATPRITVAMGRLKSVSAKSKGESLFAISIIGQSLTSLDATTHTGPKVEFQIISASYTM